MELGILRYLLEHPAAADNAVGITHWWLRGSAEVSQATVRDVLEELLQRGWLMTHGDTPETRIYALNEHAIEAVTSYAEAHGDRANG